MINKILTYFYRKTSLKKKIFVAKIFYFLLLGFKKIFKIYILDKILIKILIKLKNSKKIDEIINDHKNDDYYIKLEDVTERIKIFKESFKEFRYDFSKKDFIKILDINLKLIERFQNDCLIHYYNLTFCA